MIADAGGVELADGRRMRTGLVYRISGALAGPDELAELDRTGARTVIDLRAEFEDRTAVSEWAAAKGVEYHNYPIVVGGWTGSGSSHLMDAVADGRGFEALLDAYRELGVDFGPEFAAAFEALSQRFPAGFGCAAGKDRTGVMTAFLHVLLGATEATAIAAYLDKAPTVEQLLPQMQVLFGQAVGDEPTPSMIAAMQVNAAYLENAFAHVNERGGPEAFLRANGLTDGAISRLRDALIE